MSGTDRSDTLIVVSAAVDEKPSSVLAATVLGMHTEYQRHMDERNRSDARRTQQEEEEAGNESYMITRLFSLTCPKPILT